MNTLACRLIGFGLWLAQPTGKRTKLEDVHFLALGRWCVTKCNEAYQQDELARRHAKPSTRKRVA